MVVIYHNKKIHIYVMMVIRSLLKYVLPQKHGGGTPPIMNEERLTFLKNLIKKQVDLRLEDLCLRFQEQFQVPIAVSTMSQNLIRYGVSRKKNMVLS